MIHSRVDFLGTDGSTHHYINDRTNNVPTVSPFYYCKIDTVDGLYGADVSYESHPLPNDIGEKSGDVFRRGKTITLSGTVWAISPATLETGADFLRSVFEDVSVRKLTWTRLDGVAVYIKCRVNQDLNIAQTVSDTHRWSWTVGLRADDPRSYKASDDSLYPTFQN